MRRELGAVLLLGLILGALRVEGGQGSGGIEDEEIPVYFPLTSLNQTTNNHQKVPLRSTCDNVTKFCGGDFVECRRGYCQCQDGYAPRYDNSDICGERIYYNVDLQTDPTMIGVVIGLILMSVTLCIVMRLFAKARFRENRTIFNTPNPRLMNASLMKGSKHFFRGSSGRRGSGDSGNSGGGGEPETVPVLPTLDPGSGVQGEEASRAAAFGRAKVLRQQMNPTEVTGGAETPTTSLSGRVPLKQSKYRQDSVNSNSNV